MKTLKMKYMLFLCIVLFANCNSNENKAIEEAGNLITSTKSTFTCKIDGKEFVSTTDNANMVTDVLTKRILVSGDDTKYSISLGIPFDSQANKEINNFEGTYGDHTTHITTVDQDMITEKKLVITKRSKGFIAGTFSFKVGRGAENLKPFEITDGKFETTLLLDE
jgi:hypothetical protein